MEIHLIDPYARARGNGYRLISWNDKKTIDRFKADYMSKHGVCNWRSYINERGSARIIEPVLSDAEKEIIDDIYKGTLRSFQLDAERGYTID